MDSIIRKLVPSVPLLARTPLAFLLDVADCLIKLKHTEWSHLPPASLRMRIGVGNRLLRNHDRFITAGNDLVRDLSERAYLTPDSQVLELGCGCGRNAIALSRFLTQEGSYRGQDVDRDMIAWCQQHLAGANFQFFHADLFSSVYNPTGKPIDKYAFPSTDESISLVVAVSVFSHLLYKDFCHYVGESSRVLTKGGLLHMTVFLTDFTKSRTESRWTFPHRQENCYVENQRYPEAAVAYDLDVVRQILSANNLSLTAIYHQDLHQQTLIAQRRA
jgi:cyclopropane fatty-acyl-phospholipid synthase-like methyltransferase